MKRAISLALILVLCFGLFLPACATAGEETAELTFRAISIFVDGTEISPRDVSGNPTEPFIFSGRTYLPVRAIASALGLAVGWDGETNTVTLQSGGELDYGYGEPAKTKLVSKETITYRNIKILLNGVEVPTDTEPFIRNANNTTYLPVRAISEALGLDVDWDEATSTVILSSAATEKVLLPSRVSSTGSVSGESVFSEESRFSYDSAGRLIALSCVSDGEETRYVLSYGVDGELLSIVCSGSGYEQTSSYENGGSTVRRKTVYDDGTTEEFVQTNSFNSEGWLIKSSVSGSGYNSETLCVYNGEGQLVSEKCSESPGVGYTRTMTYGSAGELLTEDVISGGYSRSTRYSHDDEGRIVRASVSDSDIGDMEIVWSYDSAGCPVSCVQSTGGMRLSSEAVYISVPVAKMHPDVAALLRDYDIEP